MKIQDLATLALRILAIFIIAQGIMHVADIAKIWAFPAPQRADVPLVALSMAWLLAPLIIAGIIWLAAPALSRLATRGLADGPVVDFNMQALVSAAFMVAGTLLFVVSLPILVGHIVSVFTMPGGLTLIWLIAYALKCVFGLALMLGSRLLSRFLLRLRRIGVERAAGDY